MAIASGFGRGDVGQRGVLHGRDVAGGVLAAGAVDDRGTGAVTAVFSPHAATKQARMAQMRAMRWRSRVLAGEHVVGCYLLLRLGKRSAQCSTPNSLHSGHDP